MSVKRMDQAEFGEFIAQAGDSVTTIPTNSGTWAALIVIDDKFYEVTIQSSNPEAQGEVRELTREQYDYELTQDYRTHKRY